MQKIISDNDQEEDNYNLGDNIDNQRQKQWGFVWIFRKIIETYNIIEEAKRDPSIKELIDDYSNSLFRVIFSI